MQIKITRLPKKALKRIGKFYSVELCLNNCKKIKNINKVVLATSYLEEDQILVKKFKKKFNVFQGHPEDVIKRFLGVAKKYNLNTVIRVTADCPFVSPEILNFLIKNIMKVEQITLPRKNFLLVHPVKFTMLKL